MALAAWMLLLLAGHGATLSLVTAGKEVHYQWLPVPKDLFVADHATALVVLGVQAAAVLFALRKDLVAIGRTLTTHAPRGRWVLILIAVGLTGAHELWKPRPGYYFELLEAAVIQAIAVGNLILVGRAAMRIVPASLLERFEHSEGRDLVAYGAAAFVFVASLTIGGLAYEWMPHIPDEGIYLFHARYLAEGRLFVPTPPVPEAFAIDLALVDGARTVSPVPPGWPAVLSIGVLLGVPWVVNPLLGAATVIVMHKLVRRLYGPREARWATVLLAASPWFLFVSMSLMNQSSSLLPAVVSAYAVLRLRQGGKLGWAVLGGACIAMVSLIRPLEGLIVAMLMGTWCLVQGGVPIARLVTRSAVLTVSAIALGAIVLPYNAFITDDPTYFPIMAYADRVFAPGVNNLGFGPNRGLGWSNLDPQPGHDIGDAIRNANVNVFAVNVELLGWACGSMLPLALITFARRIQKQDLWLGVWVLAVSGAHGLYWFSGGPDFGARYWYLVIAPCIVLAARGAIVLGETLEEDHAGARRGVMLACVAASASALLLFVPWRCVDKYWHYRHMSGEVRSLLDVEGMDGGVVLLHGSHHPDYGAAAVFNPADVTGSKDTIYAWDRSLAISLAVVDAYAGRKLWLVEGPQITKKGFVVVAGPLDADAAKTRLEELWRTREEQTP